MKGRITFWRIVYFAILAVGLYATVLRYTKGLGAVTNLSDRFPWGLWIGFDLLCGVGLAAGGFTMAAVTHIFNVERMQPVLRPAILTAFLGYLLVVLALLYDLGRPWFIWHPMVMWNIHSVMFEVAWCVMLYTTVLAAEFSPALFERLKWGWALRAVRKTLPFFVIAGVLLSTLHQSSLGSLYLIVPNKLHPLWYSPLLPLLFYLSAIAAGCAMVILESFFSQRALAHKLSDRLREDIASMALVMLVPYGVMRLLDILQRGAMPLVFQPTLEARLFLLEIFLGLVVPVVLLAIRRVRRHPNGQGAAALFTVLGFVLHRLNVSITGMEATLRSGYFPAWTEVAVTMMIVALGIGIYGLAARYLPVFEGSHARVGTAAIEHADARGGRKGGKWETRPGGLPFGSPSS